MQVNEVPEPWASAMIAKDYTHGKRPSIRALARAAGVGSAETVRQMIYAGRAPDPETVERVASALGRSPVEVSRWVGQERTVRKSYVVPREVALLTADEQEAVSSLIRAIAKGRRTVRQATAPADHQDRGVVVPLTALPDPEDFDEQAASHSPEPAGQPEPEQP